MFYLSVKSYYYYYVVYAIYGMYVGKGRHEQCKYTGSLQYVVKPN